TSDTGLPSVFVSGATHEASRTPRAAHPARMSAVVTAVIMKRHQRRPRRSVTGRGLAGQHALLDHVVRPQQHRLRNGQAETLRRLEVDHKLELGGLLD